MKRTIRLIAIDLDGTLLNTQQEIAPITRAALQRAVEAGIGVILVTGRDALGSETVLDILGMDLPYICCAGALIRSGKNGKLISARPFHNPAELNKVIAYVRHKDAGMVADLPDGTMRWFGPDGLIQRLDPLTAKTARGSIRTFSPERDFDQPILKMSLAGGLDFLESIASDVLDGLETIDHVYAGLHYVDLTARGVHKGSALEIFAGYAGVPSTDIAAVGDQPIDLAMFSYSGLSIAMGNAPEAVKKHADWIAPSNEEDGVAHTILRILDERT